MLVSDSRVVTSYNVGMRNLLTLLFVVSVYLVQPTPAWAELVEIESLVRPVADEIAEQLEGQTVVVAARFVGKRAIYWNPHEAMATELTAALRERDIDAIRYATDHRIVSLGDKKKPFNSKDAEAIAVVRNGRRNHRSLEPLPRQVINNTAAASKMGTSIPAILSR